MARSGNGDKLGGLQGNGKEREKEKRRGKLEGVEGNVKERELWQAREKAKER